MTGHDFRQTQTALTIDAVQRDGVRLDYSTPVLGKPWSIPMEFPLYQWAVAGWSELTGIETVKAGRSVSMLAFVLGLPAIVLLLRDAGFSWGAGFWLAAVVVATPVYSFYSAAVLIESTAWCASVWFLWGLLRYRRSERWAYLGFAVGVGAIAVLVKPTTWAAMCLIWAPLWIRDSWRARQTGRWQPLALQAGLLGVALLALGYAWVGYADAIKAHNPIAHFLTSASLSGFNFGTWEQKLSPETWAKLIEHWHRDLVTFPVVAIGLLISLGWSRTRIIAGLMLLAFLGIQMIFTNLYVSHDYYLFANGFLLAAAFSVGLIFWWDRSVSWWRGKMPACLGLVVMVGSQILLYRAELLEDIRERPPHVPKMAIMVRELTRPDDVIVGQMGDWSSWLPFHAQRRALMIPNAQMFLNPDKVDQNIALLADESVPLMLVQGEASRQPDWISQRILELELHPVPLLVWHHEVTFFARYDRYAEMSAIAREVELAEVTLPEDDRILEPAELPILTAADREQITSALDPLPEAAFFPHGIILGHVEGEQSLLVHAPTDLLYAIPAGARAVQLAYAVPANVYAERDFDGLMVVVEVVDDEGNREILSRDWMSPIEGHSPRGLTLDLPARSFTALLFRVEPGPFNQPAYDQAWLQHLRFLPQ
jgi:Ca2+/Na+ antiporter